MFDAAIEELVPQPTAAVRVTQPMATLDLAALFDVLLPGVGRRLAELGVEPSGAPYGRYHEFGPEQVDVEIGIPVPGTVATLASLGEVPSGEIGLSELPGGPAAVTVHRGGYDGLSGTYEQLQAWIRASGQKEGRAPWESYVDDPSETAEEDVRTEIVWPLG